MDFKDFNEKDELHDGSLCVVKTGIVGNRHWNHLDMDFAVFKEGSFFVVDNNYEHIPDCWLNIDDYVLDYMFLGKIINL